VISCDLKWPGRLGVLVLVASMAASGCAGASKQESISASSGAGTAIKGVHFLADTGTNNERILRLNGLTLIASCRHIHGNPLPLLSVSAKTSVDNAVLASHFGQGRHGFPNYTFVLDDFDKGNGRRRDVLGTNPDKTAGTLNYSRPDGGQVSVTFVADEGTPQGACVVGGTAVSAPG
jgi:hypothetical protein